MNTSASFSGRKGGIDTRPAEVSICVGSYVGEHEMHYTYMLRAINPIDERVEYIGVRSCEGHFEDDTDYMSSSRYVAEAMEAGVRFEKIFLADWPTREDAMTHEILLHEWLDVARNPKFFNQAKQKTTGFSCYGVKQSDEVIERRVASIKISHAKPEVKAKISEASRQAQSKPDVKERHREGLKRVYEDPEKRASAGEKSRIAQKDPEVKARHAEGLRKAHARPGEKARRSEALRKAFERPESKARLSAAVSDRMKDPYVRQSLSDKLTRVYKSNDIREKVSAGVKAAWRSPESRARLVAGRRTAMADPAVRARVGEASRIAQAKPDVKARHKAAMARPEVKEKFRQTKAESTRIRRLYVEATGYTGDIRKVPIAQARAWYETISNI